MHAVIASGYLEKRGQRRKNWKLRWFILLNRALYYFKDIEEVCVSLPDSREM